MAEAFSGGSFDAVVHLVALAGVRPSLEQPAYYMDVNVNGTQILIDQIIKNGNPDSYLVHQALSMAKDRVNSSLRQTELISLCLLMLLLRQPVNCYAIQPITQIIYKLFVCVFLRYTARANHQILPSISSADS